MELTLFGSPRSRTMRTLWILAELGLEYAHEPLEWSDPALKGPDFMGLNPAGAVPTLVDGGFALSESLAINLYLAKKYGAAPFYPADVQGEADLWRWTLWAQGALEPWVQRDFRMNALRAVGEREMMALAALAMETLERALADRAWLLGDEFCVADLNVACVLSPSRAANVDFTAFPRARDWLDRCYARPAAVATRARYG